MRNLDMTNIKMSVVDTKYYFNGDNVTCEVVAELKAPETLYRRLFDYWATPLTVKATAKCHPDDKYSVAKGKKIAQAKAEGKAYIQMKNLILRKWDMLLDDIEALAPVKDKFVDKAIRCDEHNKSYISRITDDNTF